MRRDPGVALLGNAWPYSLCSPRSESQVRRFLDLEATALALWKVSLRAYRVDAGKGRLRAASPPWPAGLSTSHPGVPGAAYRLGTYRQQQPLLVASITYYLLQVSIRDY